MTIMHRWFEEVWNKGRESAIDEMSYDDVPIHDLRSPDGSSVSGMDAFKVFHRQFNAGMSEIHVEVANVVTEGDLIAARCVVTAKHTGEGMGKVPKGNPVHFTGMAMARVKDGKFVEVWNNFDFMTMFQQMD
jgi:predicted ester cyclase